MSGAARPAPRKKFPDRNESWRAKLDPVVVRRIEATQAERLHQYGYPVD